jgi:hypothetical protein
MPDTQEFKPILHIGSERPVKQLEQAPDDNTDFKLIRSDDAGVGKVL